MTASDLSEFNAKPFIKNQEFNADKQPARLEISDETMGKE